MQPNHPDLVGPPLKYMDEYQVFECIRANLYYLCCFYIMGMIDDPPCFPSLWELASCRQVHDLLKLAHTIGQPYLILAHSANSMMAVSLLRELHTTTCLHQLLADQWGKSVKLSLCPFCTYVGGTTCLI